MPATSTSCAMPKAAMGVAVSMPLVSVLAPRKLTTTSSTSGLSRSGSMPDFRPQDWQAEAAAGMADETARERCFCK